jgi:hypothetical protein
VKTIEELIEALKFGWERAEEPTWTACSINADEDGLALLDDLKNARDCRNIARECTGLPSLPDSNYRMKSRSTPERFSDCDEVTDESGRRWRYSEPGDTWYEYGTTGAAPWSARSWHRLEAEYGPLVFQPVPCDCGSGMHKRRCCFTTSPCASIPTGTVTRAGSSVGGDK